MGTFKVSVNLEGYKQGQLRRRIDEFNEKIRN